MRDIPLLTVAVTVCVYWVRVGAMAVRARHRYRHDVGMVPERPVERLMWLVFVPLVLAWCTLPWIAATRRSGPWAVPAFAREGIAYPVLRWVAAACAVAALLLTIQCWRRMGAEWRMDISERNTALITDGWFGRVRHPIYAFGILMMIATAIVLPSPPMVALAVVHFAWMNVKARNEEAHLSRMHGDSYARYVQRTGRFVPRPGRPVARNS